eukprot:251598-Rhodomonas_salina.2
MRIQRKLARVRQRPDVHVTRAHTKTHEHIQGCRHRSTYHASPEKVECPDLYVTRTHIRGRGGGGDQDSHARVDSGGRDDAHKHQKLVAAYPRSVPHNA